MTRAGTKPRTATLEIIEALRKTIEASANYQCA